MPDFYTLDIDLLKELSESTTWMPNFALEKKIRKEEKRIREEALKVAKEKFLKKGKAEGLKEGEKEKAIKIARKSIKEGLSIELISKLTGLSKKEIQKLSKTRN